MRIVSVLLAGSLVACVTAAETPAPPPARLQAENELVEFVGSVDVETGVVTLSIGRASRDDVGVASAALTEVPRAADGDAGVGAANTAEIITLSSGVFASGSAECGTVPGGGARCYSVVVDVRHFVAARHLANVYVQITSVEPGFEAYDDVSANVFSLDHTKGLWRYDAMEPARAGYEWSHAQRRWRFRMPELRPFRFDGRVVAFQHPTATSPGAPHFASLDWRGEPGAGSTMGATVSDDGRFTAFHTDRALLPEDTNGIDDVYRADRLTGELLLLSRRTDGGVTVSGASRNAWMSADGNRVAFETLATDLTTRSDTNTVSDVVVHDIAAGTTVLASRDSTGVAGQFCGTSSPYGLGSQRPQLSPNGRFVVFDSGCASLCGATTASGNVASGCLASRQQVYRVDLTDESVAGVSFQNGSHLLWSGATHTSAGGFQALSPSISDDGDRVVFHSSQTNVPGKIIPVPLPGRGTYLRVLSAETITGISTPVGTYAQYPRISGDGSTIVFVSDGAHVAGDTNPDRDAYRFKLLEPVTSLVTAGEMSLVSIRTDGLQPAGLTSAVAVAYDGCRVAFLTTQIFGLFAESGGYKTMVRDTCTGVTMGTAVRNPLLGWAASSNRPFISASGNYLAFDTTQDLSPDGSVVFEPTTPATNDAFSIRVLGP